MEYETRNITGLAGVPPLLGIKIRGVSRGEQSRQPTHFVALLDTSGSMIERLVHVKRCMKYLLNFLNEHDRISIIKFDDSAKILVNCLPVCSENRIVIDGQIDALVADGSTNMSDGLLKVREVLAGNGGTVKNGLVILTDGYANCGIKDNDGLRSLVSMMKQEHQNLSVSCVGYGLTHAGELLKNLALDGGGSYNIVTSPEHVGPVFGEILRGLISCAAQNVEVVYPSDYENFTVFNVRKDGNHNHLFIGDVYSEVETIVLLKPPASGVVPGEAVSVKGFDCVQMTDVSTVLHWDSVVADTTAYKVYYIRWELAKILEKAAAATAATATGSRSNLLSDVNALEHLLDATWNLEMLALIHAEFTMVRNMLQEPRTNRSEYIQHSAFLGSGRGATTQHGRNHGAHVVFASSENPYGVPPAGGSAMNSTQREISIAMSSVPAGGAL